MRWSQLLLPAHRDDAAMGSAGPGGPPHSPSIHPSPLPRVRRLRRRSLRGPRHGREHFIAPTTCCQWAPAVPGAGSGATRLVCLGSAPPRYGIFSCISTVLHPAKTCQAAWHCQLWRGWGGLGDWDGASHLWNPGQSKTSPIWWAPSVTRSPGKLPAGTSPGFSAGNPFGHPALGEEDLNGY